MWNNRAAWHTCSLTLPPQNVKIMSMRQRVKEAMDFIREQTKDLSEERYEEFLEQLKFELEAESELCCWGDSEEE